jgi:hypothetical protein
MSPSRRPRRRGLLATVLCGALLATTVAAGAGGAGAAPNCPPGDPDCHVPPDDPDDGGDGSGQAPWPGVVTLTSTTSSAIGLSWIVPSNATGHAVERSTGGVGGPWVNTGLGGFSGVDGGLPADTRHCYRLRAANSQGTSFSPHQCAFTRDTRRQTAYRVQVRVTTGDVGDAGTDDDVAVSVSGPGAGRQGGTTWLDTGADDFERNTTRTYDLARLDGIENSGDIHGLVLFKHGSDDWCLQGVALLVDGREVFSTDFGPPCQWLRTSAASGGLVTHDMLRADPRFTSFTVPVPDLTFHPDGSVSAVVRLDRTELESRVEAMVGHSIHGTPAYWGHLHGRPVEVSPLHAGAVEVDLDLAGDVWASDPEVDIDFTLSAATRKVGADWLLDLGVANVRAEVDLAWWQDVLDLVIPCGPVASVIADEGIPFCLAHLAAGAERQISSAIPRIAVPVNVGPEPSGLTAAFDGQGNLDVTITFPPMATTTPPATHPGPSGPPGGEIEPCAGAPRAVALRRPPPGEDPPLPPEPVDPVPGCPRVRPRVPTAA